MKNALSLILATAVMATAVPRHALAQEVSMDQALRQQQQKNDQMKIQLLTLKAQLSDLQTDLDKEQNRIGYKSAKYARNISLVVAAMAALMTVADLKGGDGHNYNFIAYGLVSAAAGLAAGLSEVGVALTNDQIDALELKIKDLQKKIATAEAMLK